VTALSIAAVKSLELRFAPVRWAFAEERRAEIDAHFAVLRRERPALWNGRVLLLHQWSLADGVFRGTYLETDFASFLAWRDWDFPDPAVRNSFSMGALQAADGPFLLGVMGAHTANAGKVYFPCGTPDPEDIAGDRVDLDGSARRELAEETGLEASGLEAEPGWTTVFAPPASPISRCCGPTRPRPCCAHASWITSCRSSSRSLRTSVSCADRPTSIR
jgi:hypothetical protein